MKLINIFYKTQFPVFYVYTSCWHSGILTAVIAFLVTSKTGCLYSEKFNAKELSRTVTKYQVSYLGKNYKVIISYFNEYYIFTKH